MADYITPLHHYFINRKHLALINNNIRIFFYHVSFNYVLFRWKFWYYFIIIIFLVLGLILWSPDLQRFQCINNLH